MLSRASTPALPYMVGLVIHGGISHTCWGVLVKQEKHGSNREYLGTTVGDTITHMDALASKRWSGGPEVVGGL